jgi:hypothetical protein
LLPKGFPAAGFCKSNRKYNQCTSGAGDGSIWRHACVWLELCVEPLTRRGCDGAWDQELELAGHLVEPAGRKLPLQASCNQLAVVLELVSFFFGCCCLQRGTSANMCDHPTSETHSGTRAAHTSTNLMLSRASISVHILTAGTHASTQERYRSHQPDSRTDS